MLSLPTNYNEPMKKIALFGTSADPPTAGHQAIIHWLAQHFDHVAVWASDNPFKAHQIPLQHRSAMLLLMIDEINAPHNNICLYPELSSPRAIETVRRAKMMWRNADFSFVIGSDLVQQLPRWHKVEDLLNQVKLLVVPRPGYLAESIDLRPLRRMGAEVSVAALTGPNVSSTDYREKGNTAALTPPIEAYIHREHLYKWQQEARKTMQTIH